MKIPKEKLDFFEGLYRNALEKQSELYENMRKSLAQYNGDSEKDHIYGSNACRNITYELIESQISTDIPKPKISGFIQNEKKIKNSKRVEMLLERLRDRLPFEKMNDIDERYTYIYGGSVWFVEWDDSLTVGKDRGEVRISNRSPSDFVGQPGIYEINDMEYCFLVFDTTAEDIARRYSLPEYELMSLESGSEDAVTLIVCYYKNEKGRVSRFIWSGDKILSDTDDFYARKSRVCTRCGHSESSCMCGESAVFKTVSEKYEMLPEDVILPDGTLVKKGTLVEYYIPKSFPIVIRKNTSGENSLLGQSDCTFIRPQQLEINRILSRVHEKLMMAGVYPYKPDGCQFRFDNSVGGKVLNLRPGESPQQFGVLDTTPDISKDLEFIDRSYEAAKKILGISDTYLGGNDDTATSGRAKELQIAQAEGRLTSKRVMKNAAYADVDRLVFELYLAYADEKRSVFRRDAFGRVENDSFCRYDFLELDEKTKEYFYDDGYLFAVEETLPAKGDRESLWKYNLENYLAGSFGEVGSSQSIARYWAAQATVGYPHASENAAVFDTERDNGRESLPSYAKP